MRLIDAESPQNRIYVSDLAIEEMKKIPTVNIDRPTRSQFKRMAVQLGYEHVVCCKDCRFSGAYSTGKPFCTHPWGPAPKTKNDFCSYGERRTDANEPDGT